MNTDNYIDPDFPTKQSAGYMFIRLFIVQICFLSAYALLLFIGDEDTVNLPFANLSALDIILILIGVVANFAVFLLIFALWYSLEYRISPKRLFIDRHIHPYHAEKTIDLRDVDRFIVREGRLGRLFNYGTVEVFLKDSKKPPIQLRGVPYVHQFHTLLNADLLVAHKYKK